MALYRSAPTGRAIRNSVPPLLLTNVSDPPWAFTTACAMDRPRPVLPTTRERESSARTKRSKTLDLGRPGGSFPTS